MYSQAHFKGCDIALAAFELAAKNIAGLELKAFGETTPSHPLPLPRNAEFHLKPRQKEIAAIYASCDAWLFASRSEGFGLPVLEAMGCRTPVIGTPTGVAPEALAGGAGILIKPEDVHDMAAAIERVSRMNDADWREMSETAAANARRYTWEDSSRRFEAALLAPAPPPRPRKRRARARSKS
jgi:glycosyltransferase involved in cell wall biosynthesis